MKISVIIPAYNVDSHLLIRCIDSVLNQSFKDFEIIIIDDGSDAEYAEKIRECKEKSNKITIIKQYNSGVSVARNNGTQIASGEYICYVDADDMVTPFFLEEAYTIAMRESSDVVFGGNVKIKGGQEYCIPEKKNSPLIDKYYGEEIRYLEQYMVGNRILKLNEEPGGEIILGQGPWTRLIKSEIAKATLFDPSLKIGEDIVWNYKILSRSKSVCVVHSAWYLYNVNPGSASRKYRKDAIEESKNSLIEIRKCLNLDNDDIYRAFCSRCISDLKRVYFTYLSYEKKNKYQLTRLLYQAPWNEAMSMRYLKLCSFPEQLIGIMYRMHVLFMYYRIRGK